MNIFKALVMREILDGKNGYLRVPVILAGLTIILLVLSSLGFGNVIYFDGMEQKDVSHLGLGDALSHLSEKDPAEASAAVALGYWAMTALPWVAFPFVVFFSLLGTLYEERRDRSILFWKSMPTADWQEVAAKLFVPIIVAPVIYLVVTIVAQIVVALFLSVVMLFQGGSLLVLWPLGWMIEMWVVSLANYYIWALWALPLLAWIALVSSYASRMPFLWAILAPAILIAVERIFFDTHRIGSWIGMRLGGWVDGAMEEYGQSLPRDMDGPRDVLQAIIGTPFFDTLIYSFASLHFWSGVVIAGGFVYATIEMRKRAI
jgi:ABC-2 type transport system permease protein